MVTIQVSQLLPKSDLPPPTDLPKVGTKLDGGMVVDSIKLPAKDIALPQNVEEAHRELMQPGGIPVEPQRLRRQAKR